MPFLSGKNRKLMLQIKQEHNSLTFEDWKKAASSADQLQHLDEKVRAGFILKPSCLWVKTVGGGGVQV